MLLLVDQGRKLMTSISKVGMDLHCCIAELYPYSVSCSSYFSSLHYISTHSPLVQISFEKRLIGNVLNHCTMSVDTKDFVMPYIDTTLFTQGQ